MKENDLIVTAINSGDNPIDATIVNNNLTIDNTQLLPREDYYKYDYITKNPLFDDGHGFSKEKFNDFYDSVVPSFSQMIENQENNTYRDLYDMRSTGEVKTPDVILTKTVNPFESQIGIAGVNVQSESPYSLMELAKKSKFYDTDTGTYSDKSVDDMTLESSFTDWAKFINSKPLVLATWDEDGTHINPFSGEEEEHKAGQIKVNSEGKAYYETLGSTRTGRNKQYLSYQDMLTVEGSTLNSADFINSNDKEKSVMGSIANMALSMAPFAVGGKVKGFYQAGLLARDLLDLVSSVGSSVENGDRNVFNTLSDNIKAWRGSTSEYGQSSFFNIENLTNMGTAVAQSWGSQRAISDGIRTFMGTEGVIAKAEAKALAEYEKQKKIRGIVGEDALLKRACQDLYIPKATAQAQKMSQVASDIALAGISGISAQDTYNTMIESGYDKTESVVAGLVAAAGFYKIGKGTGLGQIFENENALGRSAEKLLNQRAKEAIESLGGTKPSPKGMYAKGKAWAKEYFDSLKDGSANFVGKVIGEGLEESEEDLVSYGVTSLFNLAYGKEIENINWKEIGMDFVGGMLGGAMFGGMEMLHKDNINIETLIRNGYNIQETINKMYKDGKFGNRNISYVDGAPVTVNDEKQSTAYSIYKGLSLEIQNIKDLFKDIPSDRTIEEYLDIEKDKKEKAALLPFTGALDLYKDKVHQYRRAAEDYQRAQKTIDGTVGGKEIVEDSDLTKLSEDAKKKRKDNLEKLKGKVDSSRRDVNEFWSDANVKDMKGFVEFLQHYEFSRPFMSKTYYEYKKQHKGSAYSDYLKSLGTTGLYSSYNSFKDFATKVKIDTDTQAVDNTEFANILERLQSDFDNEYDKLGNINLSVSQRYILQAMYLTHGKFGKSLLAQELESVLPEVSKKLRQGNNVEDAKEAVIAEDLKELTTRISEVLNSSYDVIDQAMLEGVLTPEDTVASLRENGNEIISEADYETLVNGGLGNVSIDDLLQDNYAVNNNSYRDYVESTVSKALSEIKSRDYIKTLTREPNVTDTIDTLPVNIKNAIVALREQVADGDLTLMTMNGINDDIQECIDMIPKLIAVYQYKQHNSSTSYQGRISDLMSLSVELDLYRKFAENNAKNTLQTIRTLESKEINECINQLNQYTQVRIGDNTYNLVANCPISVDFTLIDKILFESQFHKNLIEALSKEGLSLSEALADEDFINQMFPASNNLELQDLGSDDTYKKYMYVASLMCFNPVEINNILKSKYDNKDATIVPLLEQEMAIQSVIASCQNDFSTIMKHIYSLTNQEEPLLENAVFIPGVAGSGKTSVVLGDAINILIKTQGIGADDVVITAPSKSQADRLSDVIPSSNVFSIRELLEAFLGKDVYNNIKAQEETLYYDDNQANDKLVTANIEASAGQDGTLKINSVTTPEPKVQLPKLLIIDEASFCSTVDLIILNQIAKKSGSKIIMTGDPAQRGFTSKNGMVRNIEVTSVFMCRTPELHTSMRSSNIQKNENNRSIRNVVSALLDSRTNDTTAEYKAVFDTYMPILHTLALKYYSDDTHLYGDNISSSYDVTIPTGLTGSMIFIGEESSPLYKKVKAIYPDIEIKTIRDVQGLEYDYVFSDYDTSGLVYKKDGKLSNTSELLNYMQGLYTVITRSKLGSIVVAKQNIIKDSIRDDASVEATSLADIADVLLDSRREMFSKLPSWTYSSENKSRKQLPKKSATKSTKSPEAKSSSSVIKIGGKRRKKRKSDDKKDDEVLDGDDAEEDNSSTDDDTKDDDTNDDDIKDDDTDDSTDDDSDDDDNDDDNDGNDLETSIKIPLQPYRINDNDTSIPVFTSFVELEAPVDADGTWTNTDADGNIVSRKGVGIFINKNESFSDLANKFRIIKDLYNLRSAAIYNSDCFGDFTANKTVSDIFSPEGWENRKYYVSVVDADNINSWGETDLNAESIVYNGKPVSLQLNCVAVNRNGEECSFVVGYLPNPDEATTTESKSQTFKLYNDILKKAEATGEQVDVTRLVKGSKTSSKTYTLDTPVVVGGSVDIINGGFATNTHEIQSQYVTFSDVYINVDNPKTDPNAGSAYVFYTTDKSLHKNNLPSIFCNWTGDPSLCPVKRMKLSSRGFNIKDIIKGEYSTNGRILHSGFDNSYLGFRIITELWNKRKHLRDYVTKIHQVADLAIKPSEFITRADINSVANTVQLNEDIFAFPGNPNASGIPITYHNAMKMLSQLDGIIESCMGTSVDSEHSLGLTLSIDGKPLAWNDKDCYIGDTTTLNYGSNFEATTNQGTLITTDSDAWKHVLNFLKLQCKSGGKQSIKLRINGETKSILTDPTVDFSDLDDTLNLLLHGIDKSGNRVGESKFPHGFFVNPEVNRGSNATSYTSKNQNALGVKYQLSSTPLSFFESNITVRPPSLLLDFSGIKSLEDLSKGIENKALTEKSGDNDEKKSDDSKKGLDDDNGDDTDVNDDDTTDTRTITFNNLNKLLNDSKLRGNILKSKKVCSQFGIEVKDVNDAVNELKEICINLASNKISVDEATSLFNDLNDTKDDVLACLVVINNEFENIFNDIENECK